MRPRQVGGGPPASNACPAPPGLPPLTGNIAHPVNFVLLNTFANFASESSPPFPPRLLLERVQRDEQSIRRDLAAHTKHSARASAPSRCASTTHPHVDDARPAQRYRFDERGVSGLVHPNPKRELRAVVRRARLQDVDVIGMSSKG